MGAYMRTSKGVIRLSPVIVKSTGGDKPSGEGWQRPASRPDVPIIAENEQVIYWLFGVSENSPNDYAIQLSTSAGQYRIEWGDGTTNDYNSGVTSEHLFDYASISGEPTEEGYKWVWIKAIPVTGNLTSIGINVRHSLRPVASSSNIFTPQVFEWYIQAPYVTSFPFSATTYTRYQLLDIFDYKGENNITSFTYFGMYWLNIKKINIYTSKGTNFSQLMYYCYSRNIEINIDTSNATNIGAYYTNNYAYTGAVILDIAKVTVALTASFLQGSKAIKSVRLLNMGSIHNVFNFAEMNLDVPALVAFFGDLYDRTATTTGTLTITGCFGTARLTEAQLDIARNKNWTVVL